MKKKTWKELYKPGATGSEGGIVYKDEEYGESCRITLEKCKNYYAITCGVYGAMVHTVFCNMQNADSTYESMKKELQSFIDRDTTEDEECEFYEAFVSKYQFRG